MLKVHVVEVVLRNVDAEHPTEHRHGVAGADA
jgi:hypothetical protein